MIKNSKFTQIFFRFLKEYDKESYMIVYELFRHLNVDTKDIDDTLYSLYQIACPTKHTPMNTPRDIILRMYECAEYSENTNEHYGYDNRKDFLWITKLEDLDRDWMNFYGRNKLCGKFFKLAKIEDKRKKGINIAVSPCYIEEDND